MLALRTSRFKTRIEKFKCRNFRLLVRRHGNAKRIKKKVSNFGDQNAVP